MPMIFSYLWAVNRHRTPSAFPGLEKDSSLYNAQAAVFSPDGLMLYVSTTSEAVLAINSDGTEVPAWSAAAADSDLCHIIVAPDGLAVSSNTACM